MSFYSKVAGTSKTNPDGINRQFLIRRYCKPGMRLIVKPEPDNPVDENAVALWVSTKVWFFFRADFQIGYIKQNLSGEISRHLGKGRQVRVAIANLTGGGDKPVGVNIHIDKR